MKKLCDILNGYDRVLFDMDGVITSEQRYWDCTALTVYEYLNPGCDPGEAMARLPQIRRTVSCGDRAIVYLKENGVNSNWDTTYLLLSAAMALGTREDFPAVLEHLRSLDMGAMEMYEYFADRSPIGGRNGEGYRRMVLTFQEWYLGDALFPRYWNEAPRKKGKPGLISFEEPVVPLDTLRELLRLMHGRGISMGVGTGRVRFEADYPLDLWDIRKYFDPNRLVTYNEVIAAEEAVAGGVFTKPHPYMFLKGMLGLDFDDRRIAAQAYDRSLAEKTLVVGDAAADSLAAAAAGIDFLAVLTGASGQRARGFFEEQKAAYILNDISELLEEA